MAANTTLLLKFSHVSSMRLQRTNPVDIKIIREFQPILDTRGSPFLTNEQSSEIRKNRENFLALFRQISGAVAKKASQCCSPSPSAEEIGLFLSHFNAIASDPNFPFYGNRVKIYLADKQKEVSASAAQLFAKSPPAAAEQFLRSFQQELVSLLEASATFSDLDGKQEYHLQFHAAFALSILFKYYLENSKYAGSIHATSLAHIGD